MIILLLFVIFYILYCFQLEGGVHKLNEIKPSYT